MIAEIPRTAVQPVPPVVDCAVVGGGPAGAALAGRLSALGFSVCLFERRSGTARWHGESFPAGIFPILQQLGLRDPWRFAGRPAATGTIVLWGEEAPTVIGAGEKPTFIIDRAQFDAAMVMAASEKGVQVHRPAKIVETRRIGGGWMIRAQTAAREISVTARMLAVAGGRQSPFGGRRRRHGAPTVALRARLEGMISEAGHSILEADAAGWCWAAPLPDQTTSVAVFIDPADAALAGGVARVLQDRLNRSRLCRDLARLPLSGTIQVCDASRSGTSTVVDEDIIRVGDACFATDPLSSQGVLKAIVSGLQGAAAVNTLLRRPGSIEAVKQFCASRQSEALEQDAAFASAHYRRQANATPTPFWLARLGEHRESPVIRSGLPAFDRPLLLAPDAVIAQEPVLREEFIELQPALRHSGLQRPMAFARDVPIAALVADVRKARLPAEIMRTWLARLTERDASALLIMFWQKGILVPAC